MTETAPQARKCLSRGTFKRKSGSGLKRGKGPSRGKQTVSTRKKKKSKVDLRREWLVPDTTGRLRYVGLRGIYWYWLSRDVRKTEWEKYGVCITCLEPIEDWTKADCGHIVASSWCGEYLRLNRINLTIQHKKCNNPRFCPQAGVLNAVNIDKRHGDGYMQNLLGLVKTEAKTPTQEQYRKLIRALPSYQEAVNNAQKEESLVLQ